jgi:hypothetical protein
MEVAKRLLLDQIAELDMDREKAGGKKSQDLVIFDHGLRRSVWELNPGLPRDRRVY